jgi:hypothetical protein
VVHKIGVVKISATASNTVLLKILNGDIINVGFHPIDKDNIQMTVLVRLTSITCPTLNMQRKQQMIIMVICLPVPMRVMMKAIPMLYMLGDGQHSESCW